MNSKKTTIKYFDLFAGIGGFRTAAESLRSKAYNFKHVAYCEIDKQARELYNKAQKSNGIQVIEDAKDIKTNKNKKGIKVEDFDLLFGAHKLNLKIVEIPIRYRERTYGTTNISRFKHGLILLRMCAFASRKCKFI